MRVVNSNPIIIATVSLDTNTNGTESHTYPANKSNMQYKQEQHVSTTKRTKAQTKEHSLNNIT